jgi:hypothetical protein
MYKSSSAAPKQTGNRKGSPLRNEKSSVVDDIGGVRQWRDQRVANYEFLKQKLEWKRELRKRKSSRSRSSSEGLISVGERIRFQGGSSQAYGKRMSALDAVQIAGDVVHGAEVVRLENHVDTKAIGLQVKEQRYGDLI